VTWIRSSYCHTSSCCVEVELGIDQVLVRDSKDPGGPVLQFTLDEWRVFADGMKAGEFDVE